MMDLDLEELAAGIAGVGGFGGEKVILMMPLNYDMQVIQAIEMNDHVRRSNYSFEMHNNMLRVFPIPNFHTNDMMIVGSVRKYVV